MEHCDNSIAASLEGSEPQSDQRVTEVVKITKILFEDIYMANETNVANILMF